MDTSDFYKILCIEKNASQEEIKNSYKKMVLKYHPDKNKDPKAPEMFRKVCIAYETLSDKEKRIRYDSFDEIENSNAIKEIFMYYQELIIEICEKYDLSEEEKQEIFGLFNPNDYKKEIESNDMDAANKKLADNICAYATKFAVKKITENHPYLAYAVNYITSWLV